MCLEIYSYFCAVLDSPKEVNFRQIFTHMFVRSTPYPLHENIIQNFYVTENKTLERSHTKYGSATAV